MSPRSAPDFDPVPVRGRRDGWTPARQAVFIRALAASFSVGTAAGAAGMSRESAYRLRARPGAAAWDAVLASRPGSGVPSAAMLLADRALHGKVRPVIRGGAVVGHSVRPDNAALWTLVRRLDRLVANGERRRRGSS